MQQINTQKAKIPGAKAKNAFPNKEGARHSLLINNPQDKENENYQNTSMQGFKKSKEILKKPSFASVTIPNHTVLQPQYKNFLEQ